jgi:hypothetical protein
MKFLKTLAAIDTGVAFPGNQTLYRTKILGFAVRMVSDGAGLTAEAHDNKRVADLSTLH